MKKAEFKEYSDEELLSKRNSLYTELFNLRTQLITGQLSNLKKVKETKKDIARIHTMLKERQLKNERSLRSHAVITQIKKNDYTDKKNL